MFEKLKAKFNSMKEEDARYQQLLAATKPLQTLYRITQTNEIIYDHKKKFITYNCPDINESKAEIIVKLIPLEETILDAWYAKEVLTQKEYFIIPTNYRLWFINTEVYTIFSLTESQISIVKNGMMSKILLINNVLFEVNGGNDRITKLINILTNPEERQKIITERTSYLCGIAPVYQKINSIYSGISLDKDNNLVIHTKDNNVRCHVSEITNYEILLDNHVYISKDSYKKTGLGVAKNSCYKMSLRLTINNNNQIEISILEPSSVNTKYESTGTTYQANLLFATEIVNKIKELTEPKY